MSQNSFDRYIENQIKHHHQQKAKVFFEMALGELLSQFPFDEAKEIINVYLEQIGKDKMADNQGWVCPKCKSVYSPSTKTCKKCTKLANESAKSGGPELLQE